MPNKERSIPAWYHQCWYVSLTFQKKSLQDQELLKTVPRAHVLFEYLARIYWRIRSDSVTEFRSRAHRIRRLLLTGSP